MPILLIGGSLLHADSHTFDLRDINEVNKVFAHSIFTGEINKKEKTLFKTNFGTICEVGEKKCNNWVEWESMIKPYMEE